MRCLNVEDYFDQFDLVDFLRIQSLPTYRKYIAMREKLSTRITHAMLLEEPLTSQSLIQLNNAVSELGLLLKKEINEVLLINTSNKANPQGFPQYQLGSINEYMADQLMDLIKAL